MCRACAWDGEERHCPQEVGKLSHPQITTEQWGNEAAAKDGGDQPSGGSEGT